MENTVEASLSCPDVFFQLFPDECGIVHLK